MSECDSLVLLHVLFRHGERTPVKTHMYPKDVHLNDDFHPYGLGQLTQTGKKTMYELGEILNNKYKDFLGDSYVPHKVDARATDLDRTQMSLQLVLAGLFPPKADQKLKDNLNWQPIPYKCIAIEEDKMFGGPLHDDFLKAYLDNYKKMPMKEYKDFFAYFEKHTGLENVTPRDVWITLGTISTEVEWGFEIAPWIPPVMKEIKEVGLLEYKLQTANTELKRLVAGEIFSKILNDTKAKINNKSTYDIHLYSGHDYNVAHVLTILGLMYPHFPRYAACILLEVHKIQDCYHFKVIYRDTKRSEFKLMTFPNGDTSLPLEHFEKLVLELTKLPGHL